LFHYLIIFILKNLQKYLKIFQFFLFDFIKTRVIIEVYTIFWFFQL
jgi:hypothetical protein